MYHLIKFILCQPLLDLLWNDVFPRCHDGGIGIFCYWCLLSFYWAVECHPQGSFLLTFPSHPMNSPLLRWEMHFLNNVRFSGGFLVGLWDCLQVMTVYVPGVSFCLLLVEFLQSPSMATDQNMYKSTECNNWEECKATYQSALCICMTSIYFQMSMDQICVKGVVSVSLLPTVVDGKQEWNFTSSLVQAPIMNYLISINHHSKPATYSYACLNFVLRYLTVKMDLASDWQNYGSTVSRMLGSLSVIILPVCMLCDIESKWVFLADWSHTSVKHRHFGQFFYSLLLFKRLAHALVIACGGCLSSSTTLSRWLSANWQTSTTLAQGVDGEELAQLPPSWRSVGHRANFVLQLQCPKCLVNVSGICDHWQLDASGYRWSYEQQEGSGLFRIWDEWSVHNLIPSWCLTSCSSTLSLPFPLTLYHQVVQLAPLLSSLHPWTKIKDKLQWLRKASDYSLPSVFPVHSICIDASWIKLHYLPCA